MSQRWATTTGTDPLLIVDSSDASEFVTLDRLTPDRTITVRRKDSVTSNVTPIMVAAGQTLDGVTSGSTTIDPHSELKFVAVDGGFESYQAGGVTTAIAAQHAADLGTYVQAVILRGAGIDLTGTTDSTAGIQALIDGAGPGSTIEGVSGAIYRVDGPITISWDGVTFNGQGALLKRFAGFSEGQPLVWALSRSDITVTHWQIDAGFTDLYGLGAVNLKWCTRSKVSYLKIRNSDNNACGIQGEATTACEYTHNDILGRGASSTGYGIVIGSRDAVGSPETNENLIAWNHIASTRFDGIFVTASLSSVATSSAARRNKVIGNTVVSTRDAGIESGVGTSGTIIDGNAVIGSAGPNILIRDNNGSIVKGNHCEGSLWTSGGTYGGGIAILSHYSGSDGIVITGNRCISNGGFGIVAAPNENSLSVSANHCESNTGPGIQLNATVGGSISGNVCHRNQTAGILIYAPGSTSNCDLSVSGNTCSENAGPGILNYAQSVAITGNRCFDNRVSKTQTYGVSLASSQANHCLVMGNDLRGNLTDGFHNDGAGTGHIVFNNKGHENNAVYETDVYDLRVASNLKVGGSIHGPVIDGTTNVTNVSTAPSTNPASGGYLYADGGALKWRGSSGSVTVIAPA